MSRAMLKYAAIALVVGLLIGSLIFVGLGLGSARGQSSYTGHVVDVVEDKGMLLRPSWTNMKTDPRSSDVQRYCIPPDSEDELLPQFYDAMESGDRYTVTYKRPVWVHPNDCPPESAIVTDITPVNETGDSL